MARGEILLILFFHTTAGSRSIPPFSAMAPLLDITLNVQTLWEGTHKRWGEGHWVQSGFQIHVFGIHIGGEEAAPEEDCGALVYTHHTPQGEICCEET